MTDQNPKKPKKQLNPYARFTGAGIQMAVTIALGVWGGVKLDELWATKPIFTVVLSLFSVFGALYMIYVEVKRIGDD